MASDCEKSNSLVAELIQSNHKFTRDIYHILAVNNGDVIFSPISLQIALLMALAGAPSGSTTAKEMEIGMNLSKKRDEILQGARLLLDKLENPKLKIASQIFVNQKYQLKKEYENIVMEYLKSSFETVDFVGSPVQAAATINAWVSEKTEGKISNIVSSESLKSLSRMMLVNAIHFKDDWCSKFPTSFTSDEPFYSTNDSHANVPMMHSGTYFLLKHLEKESYEVIEIPYINRGFRMLIFLPKQIEGLRQLEEKLSEIELGDVFDQLDDQGSQKVILTMPKFKMERLIDMKDMLNELGMKTMFNQDIADFSDIFSPQHKSEGLCVDGVVQSAFIEVNEHGTEAAGATRLMLRGGGSGPVNEPEPIVFKIDHPFIFLILHQSTILFMGKKIFFV